MKNEAAMEEVKAFNAELQTLYESRPPVSKAKMTDITKRAMKGVKLYKHVVHAVEKFIHKCKPEYKVPGLYVIDSIVRQSRHQFSSEKDVFAPRFQKNIKNTFQSLMKCPEDQRPKIVRVLNLWQKNGVFPIEVTQMLHEVVATQSGQQKEAVRNGDDTNLAEDPSLASKISTLANQIKEQSKENKPAFDRKLLDFDYGEEEEEKTSETGHHHHHHHHHHQPHQPHPPEPPRVEEIQKIANTVLNPTMLESIQKALAAQGMGQILKPEISSEMGMQMVPPPNHMMASPFGIPLMVANPFAGPVIQPVVPQEPDLADRKDEDFRNKEDASRRRRSRSPRRRSRSRSRSPTRSRRRSRERKRDRSSSADREHERERMSKGLPSVRRGYITVCSNTLWLGHVSKATTESDLEASFGEHGKILSIDVIPPRGCAYICMDRRQDAYRTLVNKRNIRLKNSPSRIKIAWAPHKGAKNHKNFKDYWDVDQGCFFIPEDQMPPDVDLALLEEGGMIDVDSLPDPLKKRYELLKMGAKPPSAIPNAMPAGLPGGIPLPFGVPPFPMATMGAPGNNPLSMLGMPPMGLPPMMLNPNILRPPGGPRLSLPGGQGTLPSNSSSPAAPPPPPPMSAAAPSANGDAQGSKGPPSFGSPGPRSAARGPMPQMRGPMPGMSPMSNMPPHMMPRRGHMMGGPMSRPPNMRNGPDGPLEGPDGMPPRFGMPGPDFLARHGPPPNWNGPPGGPMWRHGLPPGMRPEFARGPPPNFNGPPPMGNFPNGSPLGLMGARPPQTGGSVGVPGPDKRVPSEETSSTGGRERKKRSRWSDAPDDAPAIPPPVLASLPPVNESEAAPEVQAEASVDEPGTPVADEAEWPDKAQGDDFDMFTDSPKDKAS